MGLAVNEGGADKLLVKKGEYARLKGWSPSYVTKLLGKGLVVMDGKRVDVAATEAAIAQAQNVDRQGLREHHARQRLAGELDPHRAGAGGTDVYPNESAAARPEDGAAAPPQAPTPAPTPPPGGGAAADLFNKARAAKEAELATLARLERQEREGSLVDVASVRAAAAKVAVVITQGLDQLAPRLATKLAAESDERKCALLVDEGVREIREAMAREILKVSGEAPAGDA